MRDTGRIASERELLMLDIIRSMDQPVGSGNLVGLFEDRGISLSQATIGRLLSSLERCGYLSKDRNKGRRITTLGEAAIAQFRQGRELEEHQRKLEDLLNSRVLDTFLKVLEARQAIESAAVRLAAEHVTEEELAHLGRLVEARSSKRARSESSAREDVEFHSAIARASRNEVLELLYSIIATFGQQSELFEHMRKKAGGHYLTSHDEVLAALRAHDAERAVRIMNEHLETLKKDVRKYWTEYNTNHERPTSE